MTEVDVGFSRFFGWLLGLRGRLLEVMLDCETVGCFWMENQGVWVFLRMVVLRYGFVGEVERVVL